ncbi:iron hydrogenase small subunit [Brevinema andersonii]
MIQQMCRECIDKPLGEWAHHLLHTHFVQKPVIRSLEELLNK